MRTPHRNTTIAFAIDRGRKPFIKTREVAEAFSNALALDAGPPCPFIFALLLH